MKLKKNVSYFPVQDAEQDVLLRLRESDLSGRIADVLNILDLIAETGATPADVEQALHVLEASRQGEGLKARFDNLEARLNARIEKGLEEIEGRLSKHFAGAASVTAHDAVLDSSPSAHSELPLAASAVPQSEVPSVPPDANLAVRIGDEVVWAESAAQFYVAVWRWLFEHGKVRITDLPIATAGKKRHEVATTPVHPSGKEFYRAEAPVPGAYVEVNLSRSDIVRRAKKYLTLYGVDHELVVGPAE
jgi:hypothetical protein